MTPRTGLALLVGSVLVLAGGAVLLRKRTAQAPPAQQQMGVASIPTGDGQEVSVIFDLSASFAPYGLFDQIAVDTIGGAVEELATHHWMQPVTIVWTRIGAASILPPPICDVIEYSRKLTEATEPEKILHNGMARCASAVKVQSNKPEGLTDISGAIARAMRGREKSGASKYLVVFSDFKEDLAANTKPADFRLPGATVLMVHRPGKNETDVTAYLARIRQWAKRFTDSGAARVLDVPLNLMSRNDLVQLLVPGAQVEGSAVTILVDFKDRFRVGTDEEPADMGRLAALGQAVAHTANGWTAPVTVRIGVVGSSALHMRWAQPIVYEPRMNPRPGRLNRIEDLELAVRETVLSLRQFAPQAGSEADLLGAMALSGEGSQLEGLNKCLILVSDFAAPRGGMPAALAEPVHGTGAVLVWRPSSADGANEQQFFSRIDAWKRLLEGGQAKSACALEMATLTGRSVRDCLETK